MNKSESHLHLKVASASKQQMCETILPEYLRYLQHRGDRTIYLFIAV